MREYNEKCSYDPEYLLPEDVAWLARVRTLGLNTEEPGITNAFVSGYGQYTNLGDFHIDHPGRDANDPLWGDYRCYHSFDSGERPTYPFHDECLQVLLRCLGLQNEADIDWDILYEVFAQNCSSHAQALDIDYGPREVIEQFWTSHQGEEYVAADPSLGGRLVDVLRSLAPVKLLSDDATALGPGNKLQKDPLSALPYDLLHDIFTYLSLEDMQSLIQSSDYVYALTRNGSFWKRMLRLHLLPWLWELSPMLENGDFSQILDDKNLFQWLEAVTRPRFGIQGPLMGIANRRRIWYTCQELVPQYEEMAQPQMQAEPDDSESQAILDCAQSFQMPVVAYPIPKQTRPASTQFIRSWNELGHRPSVLRTYWRTTGALIGISITFSGTSPRVFGTTEGTPGNPLHIPSDAWIREIVVEIDDVDMFNREQDRRHIRSAMDNVPDGIACIRSLTVALTNKTSKNVHRLSGKARNERRFIVLPGLNLIGLTGQIADNGEICRLALLQAAVPGEEPSTTPSYNQAEQVLWNHSARSLYCGRSGSWYHLWAHPSLEIRTPAPFQLRNLAGDIASDMIPWQAAIWARNTEAYKMLRQISCFQPTGGTVSNSTGTRTVQLIAGLGLDYTTGAQCLLTGTGGPVPVQRSDWQSMTNFPSMEELNTTLKPFDNASTRSFSIDGPGGEIVTEVHTSVDFQAIKLFTNRGRSCSFGETDREFTEYRAEEGHMIAGLVCAFGRLAGWSSGAKMYSHWVLSGVGVLIVQEGL